LLKREGDGGKKRGRETERERGREGGGTVFDYDVMGSPMMGTI